MKKLFSLLLALVMVGSFSIPAFAAADPALIDTTRTGSISLYKYDVTGAEKDGVWDSSYVSTGIRDESGVEAILGNPARVSALNANGDAYGYAVRGVEFTYVKLADILAYTKTEDNSNRVELLYGIENSELNAAFLNVLGVTANDRFTPADKTEDGKTIYYYASDVLIDGLKNALNTNGNTFSVDRSSDDFKELFKSIERFGVKDPVLARFNKDGDLEILSGQRRHLIASELNYPVPTIIQQLDDDDAKILVADGNLHREHISTYDLSRALRMKADSMKRKAGRKLRGVKGGPETDELIAKEMGMSTMKLNRLMKLSEATQQICDLVDDGTIAVSIAYNIAFLQPKHQDMVADMIGINVKVNNENTTNLKKIAAKESLTEQKIRDVLEGKYPPKVVEKPKTVESHAPAAQPMAPAPTSIPKSPDVGTPVPGQPADKVIPFQTAPSQEAIPAPPAPAAPAQPTAAAPTVESSSASQTPPAQANNAPPVSAFPAVPAGASKETQDRENSYETKIVLRGDRLRKYFPDVSMTPLAIENSIYDALEERRQRQAKEKAKAEIFKGKKEPVK